MALGLHQGIFIIVEKHQWVNVSTVIRTFLLIYQVEMKESIYRVCWAGGCSGAKLLLTPISNSAFLIGLAAAQLISL